LAIFRRHVEEINGVLLDLTMADMDGEEIYEAMCCICDDIPVIIASGYAQEEIEQRFSGKGIAGSIQKPYQCDELAAACQQVIRA
jgi:CheY-like chemotaxis protein